MPATTEPRQSEVRVFISSTFRDMHAERDHLVTVVFPELRERVERLGLDFFDVDLRWGVPEKNADGEKANSWEYCRQWIDRVEPFFVCILGQRYGWVPAAKDFKGDEDKLRQESEPRSITDLEVRHAVLDDRKKRRSYFYLRETEAPATATEYVDPPPLSDKLEQLKNEVRSCGRPVRDYPCEWTGSGFTGMDEFGRRVLEDLWSGVLRDERYVSKDVWRQVLGTDPDADPRYTDESEPIPRELWERIVSLAKPEPKEPLDAEREQMATFATARLRWFQGRTAELEKLMAFIRATDESAPHLAVVAAQPGQGKSALLAKLSTLISDASTVLITHFVGATERSSSAYALVERLLGDLDRSSIVWPEGQQKEGQDQDQEHDFNSLCLRLAERLRDYAGERRIVILVDALNQLSDGHDLQWLPARLGPGVRVIVSCADDTTAKADSPEQRVLNALASRQPAPLRIPLGPLTEADVRTIVIVYLEEYCHELDREHLDTLCAITQARNPLYLLVMLNELSTLGGNDLNRIVPTRIAAMSQDYPDTVSLFRWVLQRLEVFGPEVVCWWCLYLAHGRAGMASHELADLLVRKVGADGAATALRIERGLRRYLQRRDAQLDFFHGQLRQAAFEQYGTQAEPATVHLDIATYFRDLADPGGDSIWSGDYPRAFSELPHHYNKARLWVKLVATLCDFDFVEAKVRWGMTLGLGYDYEAAETGLSKHNVGEAHLERVLDWHNFVAGTVRNIPSQEPFVQVAYNWASDGPVLASAKVRAERFTDPWLRLVNRPKLEFRRKCLRIFTHDKSVAAVVPTPDGGRVIAGDDDGQLSTWDLASGTFEYISTKSKICAVRITPDGRCVLIGDGGSSIEVWNVETRECLRTLNGGSCFAIMPDGNHIISAPDSKSLELRSIDTGQSLMSVKRHMPWPGNEAGKPQEWLARYQWDQDQERTYGVSAIVVTPDGRFALSSGEDNYVRVWDVVAGECLRIEYRGPALAVMPDGKRAVSVDSDGLCVWDIETGTTLKLIKDPGLNVHELGARPHRANYLAVATVTPDGRYIVSGGWDKSVRLWDPIDGHCVQVFEGHTEPITSLGVTLDGRRIISGSRDGQVRVWNVEAVVHQTSMPGHQGSVTALTVAEDKKWVVSGGVDRRICAWSPVTGECVREWGGHVGPVLSLAVTPDGRQVISGSRGEEQVKRSLPKRGGYSEITWDVSFTPGQVGIWGLDSSEMRLSDECQKDAVLEVAVTLDGQRGVSRCPPDSFVWELASPQAPRHFLDCGSFVAAERWRQIGEQVLGSDGGSFLTATDDEQHIVTGQYDKTMRIWDLAGKQIACLTLDRQVTVAAAGPGNLIVGGDKGGHIYILVLENVASSPSLRSVWSSSEEGTCVSVCPRCKEWLPVVESELGGTVECPHCKAGFGLNRFAVTVDSNLLADVRRPINPYTAGVAPASVPEATLPQPNRECEKTAQQTEKRRENRIVFSYVGYGEISLKCLNCGYEDSFEKGEARPNECPECGAPN